MFNFLIREIKKDTRKENQKVWSPVPQSTARTGWDLCIMVPTRLICCGLFHQPQSLSTCTSSQSPLHPLLDIYSSSETELALSAQCSTGYAAETG